MNKSPMIGRRCPQGPGGRDCVCCGQAPGKSRRIAKRARKRAEKFAVRLDVRRDY